MWHGDSVQCWYFFFIKICFCSLCTAVKIVFKVFSKFYLNILSEKYLPSNIYFVNFIIKRLTINVSIISLITFLFLKSINNSLPYITVNLFSPCCALATKKKYGPILILQSGDFFLHLMAITINNMKL